LVEEKVCSFCNKEFINGIPVVPPEHILDQDHCDARIAEFNNRTMTDQKSDAWLKARHECVTASVVAKITEKLESKTLKSMIIEKAHYGKYSKNIKNIYTTYGELYEPLANMVYCYRSGRKTHEFGLIKHPVYNFIGASTDGVTSDLINIEIKCPTSRVVDGHISQLYYEQMQLQMEVLDINITHFFECNFITHTIEEFINGTFKHERGIIVEYLDENVEAYEYSPLEMHKETSLLMDWKDSVHLRLMNNQKIITDTIYWSLLRVNCNEVLRDKEWFKQKLPLLENFWKKVLEERETKALEKIYYKNEGICVI
jgi:putative phage-type endonuclease